MLMEMSLTYLVSPVTLNETVMLGVSEGLGLGVTEGVWLGEVEGDTVGEVSTVPLPPSDANAPIVMTATTRHRAKNAPISLCKLDFIFLPPFFISGSRESGYAKDNIKPRIIQEPGG